MVTIDIEGAPPLDFLSDEIALHSRAVGGGR
jgi:hypothetical protein